MLRLASTHNSAINGCIGCGNKLGGGVKISKCFFQLLRRGRILRGSNTEAYLMTRSWFLISCFIALESLASRNCGTVLRCLDAMRVAASSSLLAVGKDTMSIGTP